MEIINVYGNRINNLVAFLRLENSVVPLKSSPFLKKVLLSLVIGNMAHVSSAVASEQLEKTGDILQVAVPAVAGVISIGCR